MNGPQTILPPVSGGSSPAAGPVQTKPSLEEKILKAVQESETIVSIFSPAAAEAVAAGVAVEPLFSGLLRGIIGHFRHHTGVHPPK